MGWDITTYATQNVQFLPCLKSRDHLYPNCLLVYSWTRACTWNIAVGEVWYPCLAWHAPCEEFFLLFSLRSATLSFSDVQRWLIWKHCLLERCLRALCSWTNVSRFASAGRKCIMMWVEWGAFLGHGSWCGMALCDGYWIGILCSTLFLLQYFVH